MYSVNIAILEEWVESGFVITPDGRRVKITIERGGDENFHRCMCHLKSGKCNQICLHCYLTRAQALNGDKEALRRYLFAFEDVGKEKLRDHLGRPILNGDDIWSIHYCIMHGTIPFGKDVLTYLYKWITNNHLPEAEVAQKKAIVDAFMRKNNIKISFKRGPKRGSWHIKATETFQLFKHIQVLCNDLEFDGVVLVALVRALVDKLKVLYKWEFITDEDWDELQAYEDTMEGFIANWRAQLQLGNKYRNYYHTLSVEVPKSIRKKGSAWKYSSDITETFVHVLKGMLLDFTTRGGCDQDPTRQAMERCAMRSIAYTKGFGSLSLMISPHEWKKISDYADISSIRFE